MTEIVQSVAEFANQRRTAAQQAYYDVETKKGWRVMAGPLPPRRAAVAPVIVSGTDLAAFQKALDDGAGGTVQVPDGTYNFSGKLRIKSGTNFIPINSLRVTLNFNLPGNDFAIDATNTSGAHVHGFKIKSNCGIFLANGSTGFNDSGNDLVWGSTSRGGYARHAIRAYGYADLTHENNNLHDSQDSDRNGDFLGGRGLYVRKNTYTNVNYGEHIDGQNFDVYYEDNRGRKFQRMGLELQDNNGRGGNNINVRRNVFTEWVRPTNWSFGLSIMPQFATNVSIEDNYLSTGEEPIVAGSHMGYGIEAGFTSGIVRGNVLVGKWVMGIVCSMPNVPLKDNHQFSNSALQWGAFGLEPGSGEPASIKDLGGNLRNQPISAAPTPEQFIASVGSTVPPPDNGAPTMTITNVNSIASKDATGKDQIKLTWTATGASPSDQVNIVRNMKDGTRDTSAAVIPVQSAAGEFIDQRFSADQVSKRWEFSYAVGGVKSPLAQIGLQTQQPPPAIDPANCDYIVKVRNAKQVSVTQQAAAGM